MLPFRANDNYSGLTMHEKLQIQVTDSMYVVDSRWIYPMPSAALTVVSCQQSGYSKDVAHRWSSSCGRGHPSSRHIMLSIWRSLSTAQRAYWNPSCACDSDNKWALLAANLHEPTTEASNVLETAWTYYSDHTYWARWQLSNCGEKRLISKKGGSSSSNREFLSHCRTWNVLTRWEQLL